MRAGLALLACCPGLASAHAFGQSYVLPLPVDRYLEAAAFTLVVSFLLLVLLPSASPVVRPARRWRLLAAPATHRLLVFARLGSLLLLALAISSGFVAGNTPYASFVLSYFWIALLLGLTYLCALFGAVHRVLNPWEALLALLPAEGILRCPATLGHWPAFVLLNLLMAIELFANLGPTQLAWLLGGYTLLVFIGSRLVGSATWRDQVDPLATFHRLMARLAPCHWSRDGSGNLCLQLGYANRPVVAVARDGSLIACVLFLLSATTFDGLHETLPWMTLFWETIRPILSELPGMPSLQDYTALHRVFQGWQLICLWLSTVCYALVFAGVVWLSRYLAGQTLQRGDIGREVMLLLPIILAYHLAHYGALLASQGSLFPLLLTDPLGQGWNLLGLAPGSLRPFIPDPIMVWQAQVGVIIAGHVASVWLGHRQAVTRGDHFRERLFAQLPLLGLMILLTVCGLKVLSLPLSPTA